MKHFRPLFFRDLDLRLPGIHVRRLRLNRHLRETEAVRPHRHGFSQVLLYLGGTGVQILGGRRRPVRAGAAILVPPRQWHAFQETSSRRPLCLVLDLDLRGAAAAGMRAGQLTGDELAHVRHALSALGRWQNAGGEAGVLRVGAIVLDLLEVLLRSLGWTGQPGRSRPAEAPVVKAARRLFASAEGNGLSLLAAAARLGYQRDYLNRLLRATCGQSLGQLRAEGRLRQAKQLLLQGALPVQEVGARIGIADPNYFARWFRKQTGMAPRRWRAASGS